MAFNPALDGHKINMRSEYADTVTRKWTRTEVDNIMQMLVFDSNSSALASEAMTLDAVDAEWMGDMMVLDSAVITTNMRTLNGKFTESISRTLTRKLSPDLSISGNEVGKVKKSGLYASIAAIFRVSDGQTVTIIFHAPDGDPKVIAQDDTLIAFRVLMNKTDITSHVLPQLISTKGVTSLDQVSTNIASLLKANSETFKGKQAQIANQKKELEEKMAELRKLEAAQVEAVQMEADAEERMKDADEKGAGLESRIKRVEEANAVLQEKIDRLKAKKSPPPDNIDATENTYSVSWKALNGSTVEIKLSPDDARGALGTSYVDGKVHAKRDNLKKLPKPETRNGMTAVGSIAKIALTQERYDLVQAKIDEMKADKAAQIVRNIPGAGELKAAYEKRTNELDYYQSFMEKSHRQSFNKDRQPQVEQAEADVKALEEKYPKAAQYLKWKGRDSSSDSGFRAWQAAKALEEGKSLEEAKKIADPDYKSPLIAQDSGNDTSEIKSPTIPFQNNEPAWLKEALSIGTPRTYVHRNLSEWFKRLTGDTVILDSLSQGEYDALKADVAIALAGLAAIADDAEWKKAVMDVSGKMVTLSIGVTMTDIFGENKVSGRQLKDELTRLGMADDSELDEPLGDGEFQYDGRVFAIKFENNKLIADFGDDTKDIIEINETSVDDAVSKIKDYMDNPPESEEDRAEEEGINAAYAKGNILAGSYADMEIGKVFKFAKSIVFGSIETQNGNKVKMSAKTSPSSDAVVVTGKTTNGNASENTFRLASSDSKSMFGKLLGQIIYSITGGNIDLVNSTKIELNKSKLYAVDGNESNAKNPQSVEPTQPKPQATTPHVTTLQAIVNGDYDDKLLSEVETALFTAADALEAAGLSEQYDDLIGKAAEKYAELDQKANG